MRTYIRANLPREIEARMRAKSNGSNVKDAAIYTNCLKFPNVP
jgi:hypothetical protein